MRRTRHWWFMFGAATALAVAALGWTTTVVLRLEQAEIDAKGEAVYQESLRLALWRMDSWLAPRVAREAARPWFEYEPFFANDHAYTMMLQGIQPGEVLTPSPLLSYANDNFPLHFQCDADGNLTSPQVPEGNYRDIAELDEIITPETIVANGLILEDLDRCIDTSTLPQQIACGVIAVAPLETADPVPLPVATDENLKAKQDDFAKYDGSRRAQQSTLAQEWTTSNAYGGRQQVMRMEQVEDKRPHPKQTGTKTEPQPDQPSVEVGPMVPVWLDDEGEQRLAFVRQGSREGDVFFQGVLADWSNLQAVLLGEITDLFPVAALDPVPLEIVDRSADTMLLATLPVRLDAPRPDITAEDNVTVARVTLGLAWLSLLVVVGAAGVTLRSSIAFGERRSRFASAVTHELRTPLTTFRMYSEMLADDMVQDETQRRTYLETLRSESGRLSNLVENVLSYARLEDGRARPTPAPTTVSTILDRGLPPLAQRADDADRRLDIIRPDDESIVVRADADVVAQVLLNLVDNACKYGEGTIAVEVTTTPQRVEIRVRDQGEGIPARHATSIFSAFERGAHAKDDPSPGVGIGLALSRGLARDLGGDLELEPSSDGACFLLWLARGSGDAA